MGGRCYSELTALTAPSVEMTYAGDGDEGGSPLGLHAGVLGLLTDGIALNTTAELRAGAGARAACSC